MKNLMRHLHDFRTWFAFAGMFSIVLVLLSVEGSPWTLVLLNIAVGVAVRIKYGDDVQIDQS